MEFVKYLGYKYDGTLDGEYQATNLPDSIAWDAAKKDEYYNRFDYYRADTGWLDHIDDLYDCADILLGADDKYYSVIYTTTNNLPIDRLHPTIWCEAVKI